VNSIENWAYKRGKVSQLFAYLLQIENESTKSQTQLFFVFDVSRKEKLAEANNQQKTRFF
jgi:hypothetical protein